MRINSSNKLKSGCREDEEKDARSANRRPKETGAQSLSIISIPYHTSPANSDARSDPPAANRMPCAVPISALAHADQESVISPCGSGHLKTQMRDGR